MDAEPESLLAARLIEAAEAAGLPGVIFVAHSETRAARLHRAAQALAPEAQTVLLLPGWDCLPYDRVSPSRPIMGQRMAVAPALASAEGPRLLIVSPEAATQRLPAPDPEATLRLQTGSPLDPEELRARLGALGYVIEEVVEDCGEAAIHGSVVDIMPAAADDLAWRLRHEDGQVQEMSRLDVLTQRSLPADDDASLTIGPASELILPPTDPLAQGRPPGLEHGLAAFDLPLTTPFDLLPQATIILDDGTEPALEQRWADIAEAFRTSLTLRAGDENASDLSPPQALYLDEAAWTAVMAERPASIVDPAPDNAEAPPLFVARPDAEDAFIAYARQQLQDGRKVALMGGRGRAHQRLIARLGVAAKRPDGWPAFLAMPPGSLAQFAEDTGIPGFVTADAVVIPFATIRRPATAAASVSVEGPSALAQADASLQPGDAVIHLDHGLGALRGVESVDTGDGQTDCLRLDYADAGCLVPFDELDRIWRYGADAASVSLDRLQGEAWPKRRAEVEAEVERSAHGLLDIIRARNAAKAPILTPPAKAYARVAARFPYELTPDQASAVTTTLADLASGRPMDRLVCGDVGFGKTEVALRVAAAAALAGKQVAILAPTTVLVRQHLETFRRRFAKLPVRIEALSRLTPAEDARRIRAALAKGEVQIAIGTQALAAKGVRFKDLALLIIDEEQRFGARQKEQLRQLRKSGGLHVLTMTATPIPRTLQAALVGLRELSVIATPPARRQPVRTLRAPLDDALLSQALRREARRGGQSFVVCPRIEDMAPMRERIARLVPELSLTEAHGGLPAAAVDDAMVRFADGRTDILLCTNIVEAGLDVRRANTLLLWRADRFGLSQLHQLRGRVGRGRARGVIYLLTDPAQPLAAATDRRLRTLEAMDRVGAGFAISARDLDLRGAGDLMGDMQAGHMRLVGIELYRHLLDHALAVARGETPPEDWTPKLTIGVSAFIPADYVPEEALRVDLHARLARILRSGDAAALAALEDEVEDRFGPVPDPLRNLFALAQLSGRCRSLGIARLEVGPSAAAATPRGALPAAVPAGLELRNKRVLLTRESAGAEALLATATAFLDAWQAHEPIPQAA